METRIIDLGTLPTGTVSFGNSISASGDVVVGSSTTVATTGTRAFRWQNGQMVRLTGLDNNAVSVARGVSGDGSVIAGNTSVTGIFRAWRFANGTYTQLGNLGHVTLYSQVFDMSADGASIVGESRRADGSYRAFLWKDGVMTNLGSLATYTGSIAYGIDPTGTYVTGYVFGSPSFSQQGFIWSYAAGMVAIGSPGGVSYTRGNAISTDGTVVGIGGFTGVSFGNAFSYKNGVFTDLGRLPGYTLSTATDISGDGSVIVGYSYNTTDGQPFSSTTSASAFRYTGGVMTNIGDLGTYRTADDINSATFSGRSAGDDDPTLSSLAYTVSADGNSVAGSSQVRMPTGALEQHAFLYKRIRIQLPYYDSNQKLVAQAKDNQKKFSDASSYTQFLKARASGNMYRYRD